MDTIKMNIEIALIKMEITPFSLVVYSDATFETRAYANGSLCTIQGSYTDGGKSIKLN